VSTDLFVKRSDNASTNFSRNWGIKVGVIVAGPVMIRRLLSLQDSPPNLVACRCCHRPLSYHRPPPSRLILLHRPPPAVCATTLPPPSSLQPSPHPDHSRRAIHCSSPALIMLSTHRCNCHRAPLLAIMLLSSHLPPPALVTPSDSQHDDITSAVNNII